MAGLLLVGCTEGMHRVVNTGEEDLYVVNVDSGEGEFGHGQVIAGSLSGYTGSLEIRKSPPPVVSWQLSEHGATITRKATLPRQPRAGEEVVFEIDGTNLTVRIQPAP